MLIENLKALFRHKSAHYCLIRKTKTDPKFAFKIFKAKFLCNSSKIETCRHFVVRYRLKATEVSTVSVRQGALTSLDLPAEGGGATARRCLRAISC